MKKRARRDQCLLMKSKSDSKLSPNKFYNRKKIGFGTQNSSDDEKEEVEKLNEWESKDLKMENLNSISEATIRLNKKISGQDLVEDIIVHRKLRNRLPNIKPTNVISMAQTSKNRQAKKESDQSFRERCRYFRQFEEELKGNYKELCTLLSEYKENRNELRQECCEIKKRSSEAVQVYEKCKEEFNKLEFKGKVKDQEEFYTWLAFKDSKIEELKTAEKQKFDILTEVGNDLHTRNLKLTQLDEICKNLRQKVNMVRTAQVRHYLHLLKEGKDSKSEGLQWIVIALWKLNESISISNFPAFLDEDAVHCILFIAQRTLEAEEIIENILNPARKSTIFDLGEEKQLSIKERLSKLKKSVKAERPEYVFDKKNKQMIIKWVPIDNGVENETFEEPAEEILVYEDYIGKLKELVKSIKDNEVNRLALECNLHNYEKRFKVELKDLVNAIVGAEACEKYLAVILKEKKKLIKQIEGARTFNFTSKGV